MNPVAAYLRLFRRHLPVMGVAILLTAFTTGLQAAFIRLITDMVSLLANGQTGDAFPTTARLLTLKPLYRGLLLRLDSPEQALLVLTGVLGAIVGLVVIKGIAAYGNSYLMHRVTYKVMTTTRNAMHAKILSLPLAVITRQRTGDLMSRSVDDVNVLTQSVQGFSNALQGSIAVAIFLTLMFLNSWILTLGTVIFVPFVALLIYFCGTRIRRASERLQRELGTVAARLQEGITGLKVLKGFGAEQEERARFETETRAMYRTAMRRVRVFALQGPTTELIMTIGMTGVFGLGSWLILRGMLTFSDMLAHLGMAAVLIEPMKKVGQFNAIVQQGLASMERIEEVHRLPSEDMETGEQVTTVRGEIEFCAVSFQYEDGDAPVLRGISFDVPAGYTVALVGRSGAGKTTLLQLLPRFYEPTAGVIRLDGIPTNRIALASLRSHMAMVPQETLLFAGTIAENIRLARPTATDEEVREAARRAYADDFIRAFPQGYETTLGERGVRLSGGQRQRVAIARAFLKDPRVFLLDEATASLDSESEAIIQRSFDELMRDRTTFVIAHRLSTILHADLILVIDDGMILESGTHAELLARNGIYARLYETQFLREKSGVVPTAPL